MELESHGQFYRHNPDPKYMRLFDALVTVEQSIYFPFWQELMPQMFQRADDEVDANIPDDQMRNNDQSAVNKWDDFDCPANRVSPATEKKLKNVIESNRSHSLAGTAAPSWFRSSTRSPTNSISLQASIKDQQELDIFNCDVLRTCRSTGIREYPCRKGGWDHEVTCSRKMRMRYVVGLTQPFVVAGPRLFCTTCADEKADLKEQMEETDVEEERTAVGIEI